MIAELHLCFYKKLVGFRLKIKLIRLNKRDAVCFTLFLFLMLLWFGLISKVAEYCSIFKIIYDLVPLWLCSTIVIFFFLRSYRFIPLLLYMFLFLEPGGRKKKGAGGGGVER